MLSSKIALTGGGLARTSGVEDDVRRAMCGECGGEGGGGGGGEGQRQSGGQRSTDNQ